MNLNTTAYINVTEIKYIIKALKAYRSISYGQFDRETHHTVEETQDAAKVIEQLLELAGERRRAYQNLCCYLQTANFALPESCELYLQKLNQSNI